MNNNDIADPNTPGRWAGDPGPGEPALTTGDPITELIDFSGKTDAANERTKYGFKMMKAHMLRVIFKETERLSPLLRGTARNYYAKALDDAFNVFAQVTEQNTEEELTPG